MISPIDLRSDTVTVPGEAMLKAMMNARVGDDVFGEDPTVNELEAMGAEMLGHEAAIFCPSGTMTNQIAIMVHTRPGDEVICHELSHVYNYEGGGIARNALASVKLVRNDRATIHPSEAEALINPQHDWLARTSLIVAEDTSNRGGGRCYTMDEVEQLSSFCKSKGLALHLDGARAFNAAIHMKHDLLKYGRHFDSISICLSKGLGAPVGSLLISSKEFIKEARRVRKVMGGGMRQAGFMAAAGIYALQHHIERLADDHRRARSLADALQNMHHVESVVYPETNIVLVDFSPSLKVEAVQDAMQGEGVLAVPFGKNRLRLVLHLNITDHMLEAAISRINLGLKKLEAL